MSTQLQRTNLESILDDTNWVAKTCISSGSLRDNIQSLNKAKLNNLNYKESSKLACQYSQNEDKLYEQWQRIYHQKVHDNEAEPFKSSVLKIFKIETYKTVIALCIGILCHTFTPYVLYLVYKHIISNTIHSDQNKILVLIVVLFRLLRVFCCYYSDMKFNEIGLRMYHLVCSAVTRKTLRCSPLSNKEITASQLTKMMHNDCYNIINYPARLGVMIEMIITHTCLPVIAIYVTGVPGAIGIALLFIAIFLRFIFKKYLAAGDKRINSLSNQRIKATIEVFNIIKLIKVNSLESCYFNKLRELRKAEVVELRFKVLLDMIQNTTITITKPLLIILVCKLLVLEHGKLYPEVLFTYNLCFSFINIQAIVNSFSYVDLIITSFENIESFMSQKQLKLDHIKYVKQTAADYSVQIKNGTFKWEESKLASGQQKQQNQIQKRVRRQKSLNQELKNVNFKIKKGEFVAIVGGYGAGKTSLVQSLLGQMEKVGNPQITINGTIAYSSQVPWIMNDTIKNNILFGKPYDQKRYKEAIKYSSLESDLELFKNGDLSIIGKRGSTLSGGQKARVSLARALYSDADIYILDDILSAVDAHVGSFLFFMGIKEYLKGKTILLITHSLYYVAHTDRILILEDGQVIKNGAFDQLKNEPLFNNVQTANQKLMVDYKQVLSKQIKIKEEKDVNLLPQFSQQEISTSQSFSFYIKRNSGLIFVVAMTLFVVLIGLITTYSQLNLNDWSYSVDSTQDNYFYISLIINMVKVLLCLLLARVLYVSRLFQSIHDDMIKNLLFSPYSYFENVPSAKIINRLSNDLATNDKIITSQFGYMLINLQLLLSFIFGIFYVYVLKGYYYFFIFFILVALITYHYFKIFFSLSVKINKIENELLVPINSKFTQLIDGLTSIRAYQKIGVILADFRVKFRIFAIANTLKTIIDSRIKFIILFSSNVLSILKILTMIFTMEKFRSSCIFLLFNFFSMEDGIFRFYNSLAVFAPRLESLGKCEQLTNLQQQRGYKGYLEANWVQGQQFKSTFFNKELFSKGQIKFQDYSFRYKPQLQNVLNKIKLTIRAGEKVGIVGRTGSGKSTMMLGLLRIIEGWQGKIFIDGIDISKLSLQELRSNINIILQDHFLFSGTIQDNIDPTHSHSDDQIINALTLCGIWSKFQKGQGLKTLVTEGGDNLSSGQKQLINIARSLLNPKRIVLIDEATASIDLETDSLIQKVMRKQFADKTVLTIAHRINTVLDSDRILVLNKGQVSEIDSPSNLLKNENSLFSRLYKQSGKKNND